MSLVVCGLSSCSDDKDEPSPSQPSLPEGEPLLHTKWEGKFYTGISERYNWTVEFFTDGRVTLICDFPDVSWDGQSSSVDVGSYRRTTVEGRYTVDRSKFYSVQIDMPPFFVTLPVVYPSAGEAPIRYEWWKIIHGRYDEDDQELVLSVKKAPVSNPSDTPDFDAVTWTQGFDFERIDDK